MPKTPTYKRFFTPQEANGLLDELRDMLMTAKRLLEEARAASRTLEQAETDEERSDAYCLIEERRSVINQILSQMRQKGVEIKTLEPLTINFPALRNGQRVYLCWCEGETTINSWHPLHASLRERQKLDPKHLGSWEWCN